MKEQKFEQTLFGIQDLLAWPVMKLIEWIIQFFKGRRK